MTAPPASGSRRAPLLVGALLLAALAALAQGATLPHLHETGAPGIYDLAHVLETVLAVSCLGLLPAPPAPAGAAGLAGTPPRPPAPAGPGLARPGPSAPRAPPLA
jgi:hypothetical protein